ncbi:MAG: thymidine kinase [Pseudomonadota bacterium]
MAKLYFYYSAMNAGKSTSLLQSDYNYRERGMETLLFTAGFDDRYGVGKITSRIGLQAEAIIFDEEFDFLEYMENYLAATDASKISCILVDEAHFLTKEHVEQLSDISDYLNIPVLAYGIRTDFRGELFSGSEYLLAWADKLSEIKTICHCGRKAIMNLRIDENGEVVSEGAQVHIGHDYVSVCRKHFKEKTPN